MKDLLVGYEKHFPRPRRGSTTSNSTFKVPSLFSVGDASSHDKVGAQDTTNKLEGSEADDLSITSTSLAGTSIALEVSAEDQVLQALHHQHARAIVRELLVERRNIYVWSMIVLACASDLLKLCGWDAVSESAVENKDITVLFSAKDLSAVAVGVGLSYARALTGFGMYSMAVLEFEKVLRLSPKHRTAELGRIRCLCALGDFPKAKTSLTTIIVEAFNKDIRDISLVSLMKRDTELGYLMLYIDACMNSLVSTGYGAKPDCRTYKLMDDGILDRHPLSYNLFEHGECPYNKWYVEKRKNAVMANVVRVRESEDRSKYKQKSAQTMRSAKDVIDAHKAMMMQLGPVTIT